MKILEQTILTAIRAVPAVGLAACATQPSPAAAALEPLRVIVSAIDNVAIHSYADLHGKVPGVETVVKSRRKYGHAGAVWHEAGRCHDASFDDAATSKR